MTATREPASDDRLRRHRERDDAPFHLLASDAARPSLRWLGDGVPCGGVRERRFDVLHAGRRVPGLFWTPAEADGPRPLVLLGHGGAGSKRQDDVVSMAKRLARGHGIAAAAIDGPVHGDRRTGPPAPRALVLAEFAQLWANDGDAMTDRMVDDWSSTLDALQALPDIGSGPVGWWGVSMGTIVGLPLVAADARIRASVLGLMGLTGPTKARIERDAPAVRCPVLFLVQWDDLLFPRDLAVELWEALGSRDKCLVAHPGGHGDLPAEAFEASARFLARHLGTEHTVDGGRTVGGRTVGGRTVGGRTVGGRGAHPRQSGEEGTE